MATLAEVAAHLDLSTQQVRNLIKERKVLAEASHGKHDLDDCRVRYIRHMRAAASGHRSLDGRDLTAERARLAAAQADRVELENRVRLGELVEFDQAFERVTRVLVSLKSRLRALPARLKSEIEGLTPRQVRALRDGLDEALRDAADGLEHEREDGKRKTKRRRKAAA